MNTNVPLLGNSVLLNALRVKLMRKNTLNRRIKKPNERKSKVLFNTKICTLFLIPSPNFHIVHEPKQQNDVDYLTVLLTFLLLFTVFIISKLIINHFRNKTANYHENNQLNDTN